MDSVNEGSVSRFHVGSVLFNILCTICFFSLKNIVYTILWAKIPQTHRPKIWQMYYTIWDMMTVIYWIICKNGMPANPDRLHFLLFSPTPTEQQIS